MTTAPSVRDMPSLDGDVPPLCIYDDTWLSISLEYLERAHPWLDRVTVASWYDGSIPSKFGDYLTDEPFSGGGSSQGSVSGDVSPEFKDLSDTRQQLFIEAEEKWNFGPNSGTFKVPDLAEETNATDTTSTVRKAVQEWEEKGLATQVGNKSRNKEYRLVESRFVNPDARADGGPDQADIMGDWDERVSELQDRHLWDYDGSSHTTKFDPVDWFAHENEDELLSLFGDLGRLNNLIDESKSQRQQYEEELDDHLEGYFTFSEDERVRNLKSLRETLKEIRDIVTDIFMRLSDLVGKSFRSCINWWSAVSKDGFDMAQQHAPTNKRDTITTRIDAKRWALLSTHLDPLIEADIRDQVQGKAHPERVYELEKNLRALVRWGWYMTDEVFDGSEPVQEDTVEDDEPIKQVNRYEPPSLAKIVHRAMKKEFRAIPGEAVHEPRRGIPAPMVDDVIGDWDDLVEAIDRWTDDDPSEHSIRTALEEAHKWCRKHDGPHAGIAVWDRAEPHENQHLGIALIADDSDNPEADWPENNRLEIPPLSQ